MRPVVVDSVTDVLAKVLAAGHCTGHPEWDAMPESARTYWRHRATRTRARLQEAGLDINPDQFRASPAPTDRDGDLTDIVDQIRPAISNAYYDARNAGETMEDAASRAAGAVLAVLQDAGLRASPAPTAPLDVERLRQAIKTVLYEGRETWGNADHDARLIAAEYNAATPDQRHMGSGSLDERANG